MIESVGIVVAVMNADVGSDAETVVGNDVVAFVEVTVVEKYY